MLLKHYCFTTGHHFDEYRKLNIKNPLFTLMADFFVFSGEFGAGRGMDVLLRWLWEWQGSMRQSLNSWLSEAQQQKLTFTQGSQV